MSLTLAQSCYLASISISWNLIIHIITDLQRSVIHDWEDYYTHVPHALYTVRSYFTAITDISIISIPQLNATQCTSSSLRCTGHSAVVGRETEISTATHHNTNAFNYEQAFITCTRFLFVLRCCQDRRGKKCTQLRAVHCYDTSYACLLTKPLSWGYTYFRWGKSYPAAGSQR